MGMTRSERVLSQIKVKKDSGGMGVPQISTMEEGVAVFRNTANGVVQYVKINGVLYQSAVFSKTGG